MRVLLRNERTGLYRGKELDWVAGIEDAAEFGTIQAAGQKARSSDEDELDVVLRYEDPQCELALNPAYCV
jgi:hypothetical protein